jgi:GNAT superfamily N-acetyltransferase
LQARLRNARPNEAGALTELELRSKRSWGYDDVFIEAIRSELILTPVMIARSEVIVAEEGSRAVGFARVTIEGEVATLHDLFVEPDCLRRGIGRLLCMAALQYARDRAATRMLLESDPYAEGFYLQLGAKRVGEHRSSLVPGRTLPVMQFDVVPD